MVNLFPEEVGSLSSIHSERSSSYSRSNYWKSRWWIVRNFVSLAIILDIIFETISSSFSYFYLFLLL